MKKKLSLLMALILSMALSTPWMTTALAASYLSMAINQSEPLIITNEIITNAYSSNNSVVTVERIENGAAYVRALQTGSATITVYYTNAGVSKNYEFVITVEAPKVTVNLASVGDFDMSKEVYFNVNSMRSSDTSVCKAAFVNNTVVITATGVGSAVVTYEGFRNGKWESVQIQVNVGNTAMNSGSSATNGEVISLNVGATWSSQSFYETTVVRSENENVAKIATDQYGRNIVTAMGQGSTEISYVYRLVENGPLQVVTHRVDVGGSSGNGTNTSGSQDVTLLVGNSYNTARYQIVSVSSSNTNVAQATISGSIVQGSNNMTLRIQGISAGTAVVQMEYYDSASGTKKIDNFNVSVSGSTTPNNNTQTQTTTSAITFSKSAWTVAKYNSEGKIVPYRINPRVNGTIVSADTMLWLSSDPSIFTVEATTGIFRGVKEGTARLICVDKVGGNIASISITITN